MQVSALVGFRVRGRPVPLLCRVAILTAAAWVVVLGGASTALAQATPPATSPFAVAFNYFVPPAAGGYHSRALLATANQAADTVSVFDVATSGHMREALGSPFPSGGKNPEAVAFSPSDHLLVVANAGSRNVTVFKVVETLSGVSEHFDSLKEVARVPTDGEPQALAFNTSGSLLAVANAPNSVQLFSVDDATGALTQEGSPHPLPDDADPSSVSFSSCGNLLATANSGDDTMSVLEVHSDGTLTDVTGSPFSFSPNSHPYSVSFARDPSCPAPGPSRLALVLYDVASVYMFTASPAGVSAPVITATPTAHSAVEFGGSPPGSGGAFLATANRDNTVSVFSVLPNDMLTQVPGGHAGTGGGLSSLAFATDPSFGLLATANRDDGTVSMFRSDQNGALTQVTGSPFPLLDSPVHVFLTPTSPPFFLPGEPGVPAWNPASTLFAVTNHAGFVNESNVYVARLNSDGTFDVRPPVDTGTEPISAAFRPDVGLHQDLLAVANKGDDTVTMFTVKPDGTLEYVPGSPDSNGRFPVGGSPQSLAFSPNGEFLAVLIDEETVEMFRVLDNGHLEGPLSKLLLLSPFTNGVADQPGRGCQSPGGGSGACVNLAFDSTGELLAVSRSATVSQGGSGVNIVSVSPDGKTLHLVASHEAGKSTGTGASGAFAQVWVAFSPDGRLVALTNEQPIAPKGVQSSVFLFSVTQAGADKGALSPVTGSPFPTDCGARGVAFGPEEGSFGGLLATANYSCANISLFFVGAGQRRLTEVPGSPVPTLPDEAFGLEFSPDGQFLASSFTSNFRGFTLWGPTGRIEIDKFATPSEVPPGGVLHFTLRLHNPNAYPVAGTVTDDLGDVLDKATFEHLEPATHGTATVDAAARLLTWRGTLETGQTAIIRYSVRIHAGASGIITNRVLGPFSAFCSEGPRELPCQTQTPITVPKGPGADLSVTKTPSTHNTHPGAQVLYTLTVHNHGPGNATGVTVYDSAPPGVFFHSATPTQGSPCTVTATDVTCRLGSIVQGGGAQVLVEATVATSARGDQTNVAVVRGDQHDPNPTNNTARATITVTPWTEPERVADVVVVKHAPRSVTQGQRFRYTLTVTNRGPDAAPDVIVTDVARLPFRVVSIHPSRGRCQTGPPIRCALGTLHNGARATITVTAIATTAGNQVNTATAMTSSWDPAVRSNLALARTAIRPAPRPPGFTG